MDFEDIDFDDVIAQSEKKEKAKKKKKKANSKDKGRRFENNLCKVLKNRFGFEFTRTIGSGNRWGQVSFLPHHAQQTFSGDLVCPENFKFVIECKGGYNDIDIHGAFEKGIASLDKWIKQAEDEGERCGRTPIICWKKDYKPWLSLIELSNFDEPYKLFDYHFKYRNYIMFPLLEILKFEDNFFYVKKTK
jgi:hypothetical protein